VWGRDFLARETTNPRPLVISKQWMSFLLWGRLSYDVSLPDAHLQRIAAQRFADVNATSLMSAWSAASMVFPLITRFFWGDIDLRWFPEACLSHPRYRGWFTVRHFIEGSTMPGAGVMNILDWRKKAAANELMSGTTPLQIAAQLDMVGTQALQALPGLRAKASAPETVATLDDIEAMAHLARYYAAKIQGAAALAMFDLAGKPSEQAAAVKSLEAAAQHWREYARVYAARYKQPVLYNRVGVVDIPAFIANTDADVEIARQWKPKTIDDSKVVKPRDDRPFEK
jgi:hypothetical protein